MNVTKAIEEYINERVSGSYYFADWMSCNVGKFFGEKFIVTLLEDIAEEREEETLEDVIEYAVDIALYQLKKQFKSDMDMFAIKCADSEYKELSTAQITTYFVHTPRCEEICRENGLVSTPNNPYAHMYTSVFLVLKEENLSELRDSLEDLEDIEAINIVKNVNWSDLTTNIE